jgi:hypothetical protein
MLLLTQEGQVGFKGVDIVQILLQEVYREKVLGVNDVFQEEEPAAFDR